jgi:hypothetical protein
MPLGKVFNPLRTEVYICHQNQKEKNIGNCTTLLELESQNMGTHLKGIKTSFPLLGELYHFLKCSQNTFSLLKAKCKGLTNLVAFQVHFNFFTTTYRDTSLPRSPLLHGRPV